MECQHWNGECCTKRKKKNCITNPEVAALIDFFYFSVNDNPEFGFKPEIDGQDGRRAKEALKHHTLAVLKNVITYYLQTKKARDLGIKLSTAISAHSINLWRASSNGQSRIETIMAAVGVREPRRTDRICIGSTGVLGNDVPEEDF